MKCLSFRLDTAGSPNSHVAVTAWLLPGGRWLVPVSLVGTLVIASGSNVTPGMLLKIEPANGHHCVAASVTPSSESLPT